MYSRLREKKATDSPKPNGHTNQSNVFITIITSECDLYQEANVGVKCLRKHCFLFFFVIQKK